MRRIIYYNPRATFCASNSHATLEEGRRDVRRDLRRNANVYVRAIRRFRRSWSELSHCGVHKQRVTARQTCAATPQIKYKHKYIYSARNSAAGNYRAGP